MAGLRGRTEPRLFTPPLRPLNEHTSKGFQAIRFAREVLGMVLMPWQEWLLIHLLELNPDGSFRFRTAIVLVARQNGKSTIAQVVTLWRMYVDGAGLVIGTAQSLDVAEDVWQGTVELAESVPELAAEIDAIDRTNGKKALRLAGGRRYKVAAASRRGGRGLSGDLVLLDELREHSNWLAWGAVTKTTMARPRAQVLCLSNAGDATSVVLADLRARALADIEAGGLGSLGLFEWSAPDGCDLFDPNGWCMANPSLGFTITEQALRDAANTDPEAVFRTECLCQWVSTMAPTVFDMGKWARLVDTGPASGLLKVPRVGFGVDVTLDREQTAIYVAGTAQSGRWGLELVELASGADWAPGRLRELVGRHGGAAVGFCTAGAVKSIAKPLAALGDVCEVEAMGATEFAGACGAIFDAVRAGQVSHRGDKRMDDALRAARRHWAANAWTWERVGVEVDAAPIVAATAALFVHRLHGNTAPAGAPNVW